jgi:outer membrane protein OmpA-like peptidoglycan-associated protein
MAFRLPRRLELGCKRPPGRRGNLIALAGLGAMLISPAQAQIVIGGHNGPAVSVDDSVLARLGPPLTLPQLFLGERNPGAAKRQVAANPPATHKATPSHHRGKHHVATRSKQPSRHKTAVAKAAPSHGAAAPVQTASSLNRIIHLIPPKSRLANAEPATAPTETSRPAISHQETAISAPTKPSVVALVAPAPTPKPPTSSDTPTPPVLPQQQAREETPPESVAAPSQPVVAVTPPVATAAPTVTARAAMPAPAPAPAPSMTVASAAPPPSTTVAPTAPNGVAPPVQMAAATTVGSAATAVKFKPGATDLGGSQPALDAIANRLLGNENLRVQLISHASGSADDAMEARRISLARAVAVRAYLIEKGVRSLRIDVRALGNRADNGPVADQVDLLVVSQ